MKKGVRIEIGPKRTAHVYGDRAWKDATSAGIPHMKCPQCRALLIPADRAQDFATYLEIRKQPVSVTAVLI